jgi:hypothetical protein
MLYLCIHKSETSDKFFEIKKVEKRFGRLKKSPYLCKTKEIDNDSDTNLKKS